MSETPERREAKRFEPPPWERDHSEDMRPAPEKVPGKVPESKAVPLVRKPRRGKQPEAPIIDAMLLQLSVEEPAPSKALWKIGALAAVLLASLGGMLVVWGVVATSRTAGSGIAGLTGGAVLVGFGIAFVGAGGWVIIRSLRQRGVRTSD